MYCRTFGKIILLLVAGQGVCVCVCMSVCVCVCVFVCVCTYHPCGLTTWGAMGPPGAICVGTIKMSVCACVCVCVCVGVYVWVGPVGVGGGIYLVWKIQLKSLLSL